MPFRALAMCIRTLPLTFEKCKQLHREEDTRRIDGFSFTQCHCHSCSKSLAVAPSAQAGVRGCFVLCREIHSLLSTTSTVTCVPRSTTHQPTCFLPHGGEG
jgi:hypothetical protein